MSYTKEKLYRTYRYFSTKYGYKYNTCTACSGSGYYDHNGSPPCSCCDGSGKELGNKKTIPFRKQQLIDIEKLIKKIKSETPQFEVPKPIKDLILEMKLEIDKI